MFEDAKPIEDFEDYVVDNQGTVYTVRNGARRSSSYTREGAVKITLYRNGRPYTKSLALIVAKAWSYNDHDPEIFDTPIHLDNDLSNNHADNLRWRPRWFAVKYQKQYWNEEFRFSKVRVEDCDTGEVYDNVMQVCQRYGVLFMDVIKSCNRQETVFPSWKMFVYA